MKRVHPVPALLLAFPLLLGVGCSSSYDEDSQAAAESVQVSPQQGASAMDSSANQLIATGQVMDVDQDAKTFTVQISGNALPLVLSYDDDTQIVGAQGQAQGLAGLDSGSYVTVHYERDRDVSKAVRIDIR